MESRFLLPGYKMTSLSQQDIVAIQSLLERAQDYTLLLTGGPPAPSAAEELLLDRPEMTLLQDKFLFGVVDEAGTLVGVLDVVRGYPRADTWFIGLLLLDPDHRGQGLGQHVYQDFADWAAAAGAACFKLGVLEENERALRFWQSLGFEEVERRPPRCFGQKSHTVILMRHTLEGS